MSAPPVLRSVLSSGGVAALAATVSAIEAWPAGSHAWGHYAEQTPTGPVICRTENVSACAPDVAALVEGVLRDVAGGSGVAAFKDKLNYKQPGGAGFRPHQDLLAYPGAPAVVSVLVAVDECTIESGCLWLAGGVDAALPTDDTGAVRPDVAAALDWMPAELAPGDAVVIDGLAPHRSEANRGRTPRRVLVASYAPVGSGYDRARYYTARREAMAAATDGKFRISTLADFEGVEAPVPGGVVADGCTHPGC